MSKGSNRRPEDSGLIDKNWPWETPLERKAREQELDKIQARRVKELKQDMDATAKSIGYKMPEQDLHVWDK